jgi:pseudouridine kinase
MTKNIFCSGGANIDRKLNVIGTFHNGTSNPVSSAMSFGGVARNVAENLANWTSNVHLQCATGADSDGEHLLAHMQQLGVDITHSFSLSDHSTAHYYAVLDDQGDLLSAFADMKIYDFIPADRYVAAWDCWPENSIVFIDTNLPAALIHQAVVRCKTKGIRLCIDPVSIAKASKLPASLENVYLLKPNQDEASALTGISITSITDSIKAGRLLRDRGVRNVVISMGISGYVIVNEAIEQHFPVVPADNIKDVNGAGDAFIAGILYGLQQGFSIPEACQSGSIAAALTVQSADTVASHISASSLLYPTFLI